MKRLPAIRWLPASTLILGYALCSLGAWTELVRLTIEEESGVDRFSEPITMGVPLPEGTCADVNRIGLLNATGEEIPCQVTEVARWLDGNSLKWVHLTWNQSIKATAQETVTVALSDTPRPRPTTRLTVEVTNNMVTVANRYVKFLVRGKRFSGFESVWFDPTGQGIFGEAERMVVPGGASVTWGPERSAVTVAEEQFVVPGEAVKRHSSAEDDGGQVVVEEQGPCRVVIKTTGRHRNGDRTLLNYIVRFYAYADVPVVRVSHTFVGIHGTQPVDLEFLSGLYLEIPTVLTGGVVTVGTEGDPVTVPPPAGIVQDTSDHFRITSGNERVAEGKGKSTKPQSTGWLDLRSGNRAMAVGIKWFWQMHPKSLHADAQGWVRVGLYPREATQPLEVYMGQSRTHYLTFIFHDGRRSTRDLNAFFSGQHRPLRAWAAPKYYCRDTHCFGYTVESDPALFGADWERVKRHDDILRESVKATLRKVDFRSRYGGGTDSYGIYAWGDLFHVYWAKWGQSPFHTHTWHYAWEGNYYDHPHAMLMQFIRTGEKIFLERYWPNAIQIGDVHTCNYHPRPERIGACRYCPPRNFVAQDAGNVYISNEYNHFKSQSVFAHWYLTGDWRSYDHCQLLAHYVYANRAADTGWADRGVGAQLAGLWNAYELWRDPKYLARMRDMAYRAMAQFSRKGAYAKGGFTGIANEGLCYYYWVSGDNKVIEAFRSGFEKKKRVQSHMALSYALMYRVTGEESYRELAWRCIQRESPTFGIHEGGQLFRNTHFALFFLSDASKGWKPVQAAQP